MAFCTAINCMDGRTQLPVHEFLRHKLGVEYVDTVTEPGPIKILAEQPDSETARSILRRVDISVNKHGSKCVGVVAHYDCTGNPADEATQREQLDLAVRFVAAHHPTVRVLGLWVDATWSVAQVCEARD
jgi:carbonic anhydrase